MGEKVSSNKKNIKLQADVNFRLMESFKEKAKSNGLHVPKAIEIAMLMFIESR